jgi:LacI family gluconate utilization system Gnt-I transcriptional repressor
LTGRNRAAARTSAVKITDVAAAAGVAPMTVSRVLNTPDRVSDATRARVLAAIDQLGYVPNLIAGGLSSRRSRLIAAVVPTIASPMFAQPIQAFTATLDAAGYPVLLALSGYREGGEDEPVRAMLARRPDALLLTGTQHSPVARRMLGDAGIPIVEIWDAAGEPLDMLVGFDHREIGTAVADFFLAAGHRRCAVLAAADPRAVIRHDGFIDRVRSAGAELIETEPLPSPAGILDGRRGLAAIADRLAPRTALFCSSDLVAFGALTEARQRGIAVPETLAICGFGDFELSRGCEPPLSSVGVDGAATGRLAAQHLLARLVGETAPRRTLVPFHLLPRATT